MKLSILIPSLESRAAQLICLKEELFAQIVQCKAVDDVEIITSVDRGEATIGSKRNLLLSKATGSYICFFDDDDTPSTTYVQKILDCIETACDNCSMIGRITFDGSTPEIFEHSIKYKEYRTNETVPVKYERYPNHLNVIRAEIAKKFSFPEINHGEDTDWATQIFKSGLLKNETKIEGVLYHYDYKTKND
ncbi:MAG: hypothetical protein A2Z57_04835 [Planctomycetes bacterium RIFCSPHIGHO2_12_39_6]|nr:MAG: hypothetical protein A2Z57_04835 [Planctomycetes bacterium RIFCSPHIGHO2_12_39_6]